MQTSIAIIEKGFMIFANVDPTRKKANQMKDGECEFEERMSDDLHSEFRSVKNPDWYVGFTKEGKPFRGKAHTKIRKKGGKDKLCFQFLPACPVPACHKSGFSNQRKHRKCETENHRPAPEATAIIDRSP
ncbi:unnamed protein product [Allacma fusca]|uniref:Uncharacterized protein n=1 Tax=Allacma fusca TaxID=39272 RepID=A0A8J2KD86_9HEXA|nr:unnamed protein product [Allacma fusca]